MLAFAERGGVFAYGEEEVEEDEEEGEVAGAPALDDADELLLAARAGSDDTLTVSPRMATGALKQNKPWHRTPDKAAGQQVRWRAPGR